MANNKRKQRRPGSKPYNNLDFQSYKIGPSMKERMGSGSDDGGWGFFIAFIVFIIAAIIGIIASISSK